MLIGSDEEFEKKIKNIIERRRTFESGFVNDSLSNVQKDDKNDPGKVADVGDEEAE